MNRDDDKPFVTKCILCGCTFQFGPHIYKGKAQPDWGGVMLCEGCCRSNWDGIVPGTRSAPLFEHLEALGIPIKLNANGWLDIPNNYPPHW